MKPLERTLWTALALLVIVQLFGAAPAATVAKGPLHIVLIRETLDTSAELERLVNAMQTGSPAEYLKSKGHKFEALDDEQPEVKAHPEWIESSQLPVVAVLDGKTQQVLYREPLPATADELLKSLKDKGA